MLNENKCSAERFLVELGKIIKAIDEKMEKEKKTPIGLKILGKEKLSKKDVIRIVEKIAPRYIYYLDQKERKKFEINSLSENFWKEIEELEKNNKIKFLIFCGYLEKI